MEKPTSNTGTVVHNFDSLAFVATDALPRDCEPSKRLHEPTQMISTIDPISGNDIEDLEGKPYIVDGNIVMYFESESTRQAYIDTPIDHPVPLPDNPVDEGWAEG